MPNISSQDRAWKFYENDPELYNTSYLADKNLFEGTKLIFNPVPKTVLIMNALTMQDKIRVELNGDPNDSGITDIWEFNNFQSMKYLLALWLILTQKAVIELVKSEEGVTFVLHDPNHVETKYVDGKMVYARIVGTAEVFSMEGKKFEEVSVERRYYNVDGYRYIEEYRDGEMVEADSRPLVWDFIPVVEFDTDYNLEPMFDKIDQHNQLSAFLNAIFFIHGDPIIWDTLTGRQFSEDNKEKMRSSRGKAMKMLHLGPDGTMGYLEMQGNVAKLMAEEKKHLEEIITNDYPEYKLADLLSRGDPSGNALEIKAVEIISKVKSLRGDINDGMVKVNNYALQMQGKKPIHHEVKFGNILPSDLMQLVGILETLRGIKLITKETAMKKIPEIIKNPQAELKGLQEEEQQIRDQIAREFDGHADTED